MSKSCFKFKKQIIYILAIIFFITSIIAYAQENKVIPKLTIEIIENNYNPQQPQFKWNKIKDVNEYELFINGETSYAGKENSYFPRKNISFGENSVSVKAKLNDLSICESDTIPFRIIEKRLNLTIDNNNENVKKPIFRWSMIPWVKEYQLYVDDKMIYSGKKVVYQTIDEIDFGYHKAYVIAVKSDKTNTTGETKEFVVGMPKPVIISGIDTYTYFQKPTIIWDEPASAVGVELYINDKKVLDRYTFDYQKSEFTKTVNFGKRTWIIPKDYSVGRGIEKSYRPQYEPNENLSFDKHIWYVIAKNAIQRVDSDKASLSVLQLGIVNLNKPNDEYVHTNTRYPTFSWTKPTNGSEVCKEIEAEPFMYELYFNKKLIYKGTNTEYRPVKIKQGNYTWYVKTTCGDQTTLSEKRKFQLNLVK